MPLVWGSVESKGGREAQCVQQRADSRQRHGLTGSRCMRAPRMPKGGGAETGQEIRDIGQVLALRAHCVHTAHTQAGILTQEYLSLV